MPADFAFRIERAHAPPRATRARIPRGVGLLIGAAVSLLLWAGIFAGVRALLF